ncbi:hypothetical protein [Campylobacter sp. JMF_03 NE3]|uniref:hypothetical protein n=1 Tax=Campylobacter sp. JMF_03 NE3 TaxID=2983831 RepID=UPI0022E9E4D6|nr:hypothetical protein [Campylobacter sp. JMF_03 NE3]MDA3053565.1 hypothetical protein [Campylobacter sp. JMF_03 NE3]
MSYLVTIFNKGEKIAEMKFNNKDLANEWAEMTTDRLRKMGYSPSLTIREIK